MPAEFVYLDTLDPTIVNELRYAGSHNFVGRPVAGYGGPRVIVTLAAARALTAVQADLQKKDLGLKVYDGYRPQRATDFFVRWAEQAADTLMQAEFYPRVPKSRIFEEGYVSRQSGHSRGSTVDVTIIPFPPPPQGRYQSGDPLVDGTAAKGVRFDDNSIDMGTGYDVFDPLSHTDAPEVTGVARANRDLLRQVMQYHGFINYPNEWWQYTLRDEPFPERFFDFEIR